MGCFQFFGYSREIDIPVKIFDGSVKIIYEFQGILLTANGATGECWQPGRQIISSPGGKCFRHFWRPGGISCFIAVEMYMRETIAYQITQMLLNFTDDMVHMKINGLLAHFI